MINNLTFKTNIENILKKSSNNILKSLLKIQNLT